LNNIIVAFPKQETAQNLKKILLQNGFHVDAVCSTGSQALQSANELGGGIVICGYRFVDMMYTELHEYLPDQWRNGECQSVKGAFRVSHGHVWSA